MGHTALLEHPATDTGARLISAAEIAFVRNWLLRDARMVSLAFWILLPVTLGLVALWFFVMVNDGNVLILVSGLLIHGLLTALLYALRQAGANVRTRVNALSPRQRVETLSGIFREEVYGSRPPRCEQWIGDCLVLVPAPLSKYLSKTRYAEAEGVLFRRAAIARNGRVAPVYLLVSANGRRPA